MYYICEDSIGAAWQSVYKLVSSKGEQVKDGDINLLESLDVFVEVTKIDKKDEILDKYADSEMITWMVKENFGGQKPVLNWGYSYGMRFRDFHGVDQIKKIKDKLSSNPESKSATISLMDVTTDYEGHMPCIIGLDFKLRHNKLHITGYFRSQDIGKKIYADFLALSDIQDEIVKHLAVGKGSIKILISSAHIYEQDFGKFKT